MPVTILAGHYGSGKTQIAVNLALMLRAGRERVALADLDIVNPYFRTLDCRDILEAAGVRLLTSAYAGTNVELPALPPDAAAIFDDAGMHSVVDVGGDDRGAIVLGRYAGRLSENSEAMLVVNKYRPLTSDARSAVEVCREIESAGKFSFSGIINNSNLGAATTARDILDSRDYAREVSARLGLPVKYNTVMEKLSGELEEKIDNILPIRIYSKQAWRI